MEYLQPSRVPAALAAAIASTFLVLLVLLAVELIFNHADFSSVPEAAEFLVAVFFIAAFHAFGIGLPVHALVPSRWRYSLRAIVPGSFLVGALPMPLLFLLVEGLDTGSSLPESLAGLLGPAAAFGTIGLAGGIAFWLMVRGWGAEQG